MKIYSYKEGQIIENKNLIEALEIDVEKEKVITLVGGGGKTTTMFKLAQEISNLSKKAIVTTTTHMALEDDFVLIDKEDDLRLVEDIFKSENLVKIGKKESEYKIKSLDFHLLKKAISLADNILIEGDGSKRLPLKVPRENEPVIIENTDLVIGIIGIDCIDKKIADICHRPDDVAAFLQKSTGEYIKCEDVVKIATSQSGLKKNVNCRYKVVINKVDSEKYLDKCRKISELCQKFDVNVVFTSHKI